MTTEKPNLKKIFLFALPVSIELMSYMLFGVIDQIFVAFIGDIQVAAVGLTNQVFFSCDLTLGAIGLAMSTVISRHFGNKEIKTFIEVSCQFFGVGLLISFVTGGIFFGGAKPIMQWMGARTELLSIAIHFFKLVAWSFVFLYMSELMNKIVRSMGDSKTPMIITFLSLGLNTILNAIVVFGPDAISAWGITGIGIATVVSRAANFFIILFILVRKEIFRQHMISWRKISSFKGLMSIIRNILPVFSGEAIRNFGLILFMAITARISTEALIAYQILVNIEMFFVIFSYGFCVSGLVLVGHEIGRNDIPQARSLAKIILKLTFRVSCLTGLMTMGMIVVIRHLYPNVSDEALRLLVIGLIIFGFFQPLKSVGMVLRNGLLRGGGDHNFLLLAEIISTCIGLCMAWIFTKHIYIGIYGVFLGTLSAAAIKYSLYSYRFKGVKWIQSIKISGKESN